MMKRSFILFSLPVLVLIVAITVYAVEYSTWGKTKATFHGEVGQLAKPGGGQGKGPDQTVYSVDAMKNAPGCQFEPADPNEPVLSSTCPGSTSGRNLYVEWPRGEECITIRPLESSYPLTNDPSLSVSMRKGGIFEIRLWIQDKEGPDGIIHSTDKIPIDPPEMPSPEGFTLHVHAEGVQVWRHKGHVGGPRVEMIGTISVGDIVFTPKL